LPRHYDTLAHHYDQGGEWQKAFQYHWLSGQRDAQTYANQDAVSHLQRALAIAPLAAPSAYALGQVHFELGKALVVTGAFDEALEHLLQAWDLFGDTPGEAAALQRARVSYEIGRVYVRKGGGEDLETALEWQGRGTELLPETPKAEAALLHLLGAAVGIRQGDLERVNRECEQALELAEATGAKSELGLAHRLSAFSAHVRGRLDLALAHCQSSIEVCQELSDVLGLAKDYANQGIVALWMGDWETAETSYLEALKAQERIGDKFQTAVTSCNLGDLYYHKGELEQGFTYARRGLETFEELESSQEIIAHVILATLFWRQDGLEQARAHLSEARTLIETHNAAQLEPTVGRWSVQTHLAGGDMTQAETEIQTLLALGMDALDTEAEPMQRLQGQILAAQGKLAEATQVLQESLERLEQSQAHYEIGCTLLALAGVLAQIQGRAAEARESAERARAIFADLGAKLDLKEADELLARF
jgi:tetratricopeptide (TPR) repeat protein